MRLASIFVLSIFSASLYAAPPPESAKPFVPVKMKTGQQDPKPRDIFHTVMAELRSLNEEALTQRAVEAARAQIAILRDLLPDWCVQVPVSILLHVNFQPGENNFERAKKFVRVGLFVRDMYEDLPINHDAFLTTNTDDRLDDDARYRLVGRCFLEAYNLIEPDLEYAHDDLLLSLADVGRWALYYLSRGHESSADRYNDALRMNRFANLARLSHAGRLENDAHLQGLAQASMNVVAQQLMPLLLPFAH